MKIYQVFCCHLRHGECVVGIYDNKQAADDHKAHLDATIDGWSNYDGGSIETTEVQSQFTPPVEGSISRKT